MLPVAGRGSATWKATIRREGLPIHEVMRLWRRAQRDRRRCRAGRPLGPTRPRNSPPPRIPSVGAASVFIGQFHAGEIFNQYPQAAWLEGTRRWLPGTDPSTVERDFHACGLADLAGDTRTTITCDWIMIRDAFALDPTDPLASAFQDCYRATSGGTFLPTGPKPFVDDGQWLLLPGRRGHLLTVHGPRGAGGSTPSRNGSISTTSSVSLRRFMLQLRQSIAMQML